MILGLPQQQMRPAALSLPPSGAISTSPQPSFQVPAAQAPAQGQPQQQAQMPLQGQVPAPSPLLASMVAGSSQPQEQSSPIAGSPQLQQALLAQSLINNPSGNASSGPLGNLFNQYVNPLFSPGPMTPAAQTAAISG